VLAVYALISGLVRIQDRELCCRCMGWVVTF